MNFDVGAGEISRFGFDVGGEAFPASLDKLRSLGNCSVAGLNCHFHTAHRDTDTYNLIIKRMSSLVSEFWGGQLPTFVDIGGGCLGKMPSDLEKQFNFTIPSYRDYANSIATPVAEAFSDGTGPELILEPGVGLTADIMKWLLTDSKEAKDSASSGKIQPC